MQGSCCPPFEIILTRVVHAEVDEEAQPGVFEVLLRYYMDDLF